MQKKNLIKIFSSALILSFLFGVIIGYSQAPTSTTWLQAGSLTETATYVFWVDSGTYYAKNGETGRIQYYGTNASDVLTDAFNNMDAYRGRISFLSGAYTFTNNITVPQYAGIWGEGHENTKIYCSGATTFILSSNTIVNDLTLDGSLQTGTHPLIYGDGITNSLIQNILTQNATGSGIWITNAFRNRITNVISRYNSNFGIYLSGSDQNTLSNCEVFLNSYNGVAIAYGSDRNTISDIVALNNTWHGLHIDQNSASNTVTNLVSMYNDDGLQISLSNGNIVTNCELSFNHALGFYLNNANYTVVNNVLASSNGQTYLGYPNVFLSTDTTGGAYNNILTNVLCLAGGGSGLNETTGDYNIIIACQSQSAPSGANIYVSGGNTKVNLCYNGTAWIP